MKKTLALIMVCLMLLSATSCMNLLPQSLKDVYYQSKYPKPEFPLPEHYVFTDPIQRISDEELKAFVKEMKGMTQAPGDKECALKFIIAMLPIGEVLEDVKTLEPSDLLTDKTKLTNASKKLDRAQEALEEIDPTPNFKNMIRIVIEVVKVLRDGIDRCRDSTVDTTRNGAYDDAGHVRSNYKKLQHKRTGNLT